MTTILKMMKPTSRLQPTLPATAVMWSPCSLAVRDGGVDTIATGITPVLVTDAPQWTQKRP
jgi:hypothetical protein